MENVEEKIKIVKKKYGEKRKTKKKNESISHTHTHRGKNNRMRNIICFLYLLKNKKISL